MFYGLTRRLPHEGLGYDDYYEGLLIRFYYTFCNESIKLLGKMVRCRTNVLYHLLKKISNLLAGSSTLFLIDDIIADETLDKCHQPLLELAISGRHRQHSLWLLTQSYTAVPNNIRRQAKMLYVWYPKNRTDLNTIHEENDVIEMGELARAKTELKRGKHTCLIMRMEHPRAYMIR